MDLKELLEDLTKEDIQVNNYDVVDYCETFGVYPMTFNDVKENIILWEDLSEFICNFINWHDVIQNYNYFILAGGNYYDVEDIEILPANINTEILKHKLFKMMDNINLNDYILTEFNKYNYCYHDIISIRINDDVVSNLASDLNNDFEIIPIKEYWELIKIFINELEMEDIEIIYNEILQLPFDFDINKYYTLIQDKWDFEKENYKKLVVLEDG